MNCGRALARPLKAKGGPMKILSRAKQLLDRLAKFYAGLLDFLLA